jgi:hypothetical protein
VVVAAFVGGLFGSLNAGAISCDRMTDVAADSKNLEANHTPIASYCIMDY